MKHKWNILVGADKNKIINAIEEFKLSLKINKEILGGVETSKRIVKIIKIMEGKFKDKRLLVISSSFPDKTNNFYGGIFVKEQLKYLKDYFKKVIVISPVPQTFDIFEMDKWCKNYGFDNIEVYFPRYWCVPLFGFKKRLGNRQFKVVDKLIKKENLKFDLIHCHFTYPASYVGVKLKEKYKKPLVVTAHGYDIYDLPFRNEFWKNKLSHILNKADKIIAVSERNLNCIEKLGFKNTAVVIPNGFDKEKFYYKDMLKCRKKLNLPLDKKIILTVGNLVEVKGQKYLIEAMKSIVKQRKDVLCYIVGEGKLKSKLTKKIKTLGLQDYIKLMGEESHTKIPLWMNACDLFVLPSLNESFGVVQIEAMACGKPVVATKNGGSEEIITSKDYGLLCEPANPEDLAEKILIGLDKKWDEEYILNYAKQFTWEKIAKEIINIYERVLK